MWIPEIERHWGQQWITERVSGGVMEGIGQRETREDVASGTCGSLRATGLSTVIERSMQDTWFILWLERGQPHADSRGIDV
jgi:hypothetical protein